jgi:signal transduction histidine kinase/ActR/RegA family two-component response regulator
MSAEQSEPTPPTRTIDQRSFVRDLTSLLGLPAFWGGTDPEFVLRSLFEALESLLPLDVCYGVAMLRADEPLRMLRVNQRTVSATDSAWVPVVAFADVLPAADLVRTLDIEGQALRCIRLPIGYFGEVGRIVVGSSRQTFPDEQEIVTLRAALSLAAAGLQTARLIRERDDAHRAKDEFLAMLGHELRNPLAPIVTSLHLIKLKSGGVRSPEHEIIERQVKHLKTLVDDLLDIARITRGKIALRMESVDLGEVITRAVETVSPLIEACKHAIRVQVPRGLMLEADPQRMHQVVGNLLINAAKYTPLGGRIEVVAVAEDGWVTIRVVDSGIGLSSELMQHIFEAFVQGPQGLARSTGGLGVGLAIVKRLVEDHGGTVSVQSDGPGQGSVFSVKLPSITIAARNCAPARTVSGKLAHRQPVTGSVLIVDDNRDAADLAAIALSQLGHRVATAYCGFEALQECANGAFDVVLLDIGLPDIDGYRVAAELRDQRSLGRARVIALKRYGQSHDYERSAKVGFDAHLTKPIEPENLAAVVHAVIESQRAEDRAIARQRSA